MTARNLGTLVMMAVALHGLGGTYARAQHRSYVTIQVVSARPSTPPDRLAAFREWASRAASEQGLVVTPSAEAWVREHGATMGVTRRRLERFSEVERLLVRAREQTAELEEKDALRSLSQAARIVEDHIDVAGASHWLADIQIAIAVTAAQSGLQGVADAALEKAMTLAPNRGVRAAEAPPQVARRAKEIAARVMRGPVGMLDVRTRRPGARVFVNDRFVGTTPVRSRVRVGRHAVRLEAKGYKPYGRLVDVFEGLRAPWFVRLARAEQISSAVVLDRAHQQGDVRAAAAEIKNVFDATDAVELWAVKVGAGPRVRAHVTVCTPRGCSAPHRVEGADGSWSPARPKTKSGRVLTRQLTDADRWLERRIDTAKTYPWYRRWYVWVAASAVLAAGVGVWVIRNQQEPDPVRDTVIDFGDLAAPE